MNIEILEGEIWKDVVGYEGFYMVSNLGRVFAVDRIHKFREFDRKLKGRLLNPHLNSNGRMQVRLSNVVSSLRFYVHRLVAIAFIPNPDNLPQINHKDLDPKNNHVSNLEWIDAIGNIHHYKQIVSKTKHIGITFRSSNGRYRLRLPVDGKTKEFGNYATIEEAVAAKTAFFSLE
jgi:hypothetical protein